ncbi:MAG: ATP-dependent zinc metalloprotease FtsH [Anaerolineae bacterium]|nr:MAG: ATP-dependent zinc metalloprotease FtsH [Anaerolineae bacterium]
MFYILLFIIIIAMIMVQIQQPAQEEALTINQVASDIKAGRVSRIIIEASDRLRLIYAGSLDTERISHKEPNSTLVEQLTGLGVTPEELAPDKISIEVRPPSAWLDVLTILGYIAPFIILAFVFWFVFRQAQGSNNAAMSFGKSRARMFSGEHPTVTFNDVAGVEEAKEGLQEIVEFLREPEKFISLGARIPKGVLLVGPPGTGKTLLAKAVSGEAGVPFFSISGSEFVEMFVGVGASRVRDLFEQAKRHSPCIVFIDEIDAVGRQRGAGLGGSHDEREQTLNQMLVEMDGFDTDTNIIMVAATNRPDILDPALLRPGRFDRQVVLDRPDVRGREAILNVHVKGKPLEPNIDLSVLARGTPGFVGADLENLVNEAAILAARREKKAIGQPEFQEAIERVIAGPERKSRLISPDEKLIIAYHEAGHAIVSNALPNADPVHKVTIIPRGRALGYMMHMPDEDREMQSRNKMLDDMATALGGRAAEELIFDDITSGASSDLQSVTRTARTMIMRLGMSKKLGTRVYGQKEELVFLGREISEQKDYSEAVAELIDREVLELVNEAYDRAKEVLTKYKDKLDEVARKLLEVETLPREEFDKIFPPPVQKRIGGTPIAMNGATG